LFRLFDAGVVRDRWEGKAVTSYPWSSVAPSPDRVTSHPKPSPNLIPAISSFPHSYELPLKWLRDPIHVDSDANEDDGPEGDVEGQKQCGHGSVVVPGGSAVEVVKPSVLLFLNLGDVAVELGYCLLWCLCLALPERGETASL